MPFRYNLLHLRTEVLSNIQQSYDWKYASDFFLALSDNACRHIAAPQKINIYIRILSNLSQQCISYLAWTTPSAWRHISWYLSIERSTAITASWNLIYKHRKSFRSACIYTLPQHWLECNRPPRIYTRVKDQYRTCSGCMNRGSTFSWLWPWSGQYGTSNLWKWRERGTHVRTLSGAQWIKDCS